MAAITKLVSLAAVCISVVATTVYSEERATIVNQTKVKVHYSLKWNDYADTFFLSLEPGQERYASRGNGAILTIKFNATPGVSPPDEKTYRVPTAKVSSGPGIRSYFRQITPTRIDLKQD